MILMAADFILWITLRATMSGPILPDIINPGFDTKFARLRRPTHGQAC
jgi:hypothetical protein